MDLKGSLVDTYLKLYPSDNLTTFLQTIPLADDVPENIQQFLKSTNDSLKKKKQNTTKEVKDIVNLTASDIENLNKIKEKVKEVYGDEPELELPNEEVSNISDEVSVTSKEVSEPSNAESTKASDSTTDVTSQNSFDEIQPEREGPFLYLTDIEWLYAYLEKKRKTEKNVPYLHELLEGTDIDTPRNTILKRNPVLEARCVKLRAQQEAREYRKMTKSVDNVRMRFPDDSISYQLKQINRQLIAIGQFIISIFAGFLFGFKGIEWMIGPLDFGFKLLLGVMCALIIALAEIYFLAKKLNEELTVPETVQLGGPPQFADKKTYNFEPRTNKETPVLDKEHQD